MTPNFADYGYFGVFVALIAAGFGFPIPEELPVLTAGVLVGHGDTLPQGQEYLDPHRLRWWIMWPLTIIGVVISDSLIYFAGRTWGVKLLENSWVKRRILTPETRAKIEKNFHERGIMILLTARLTPGIRTPVFMMAGILKVPIRRFMLADGLYAIPGVSILFWLAYFLTDQVMEVFQKIEQYRPLIIVGVLSAVAGVIVYRFLANRNKVNTGDPGKVPIYARPVEKVTQAIEQVAERALGKVEQTVGKVLHHQAHEAAVTPETTKVPEVPNPSVSGKTTSAATSPTTSPSEQTKTGPMPPG